MLVKMDEILIKARKEGYGVIAVSCFSLELIKAAISADLEENLWANGAGAVYDSG